MAIPSWLWGLAGGAGGFGLSKLLGNKNTKQTELQIDLPSFYEDPYYKKTQDYLYPFGTNMLAGNVPDYYKPIGEWGGTELENLLGLTRRDVTNAVNENLTRRNISRGGLGASVIAKTMADTTTKARWDDYMRAIQGRQYLLGMGLNTVQGVGSSALNFMGQKNQFELNKAGLASDIEKYNAAIEAQRKAQQDAMWSQILSSAIGAAGTIGGFMIGGPVGAGIGGSLGSASGGYLPSLGLVGYLPSLGSGTGRMGASPMELMDILRNIPR